MENGWCPVFLIITKNQNKLVFDKDFILDFIYSNICKQIKKWNELTFDNNFILDLILLKNV